MEYERRIGWIFCIFLGLILSTSKAHAQDLSTGPVAQALQASHLPAAVVDGRAAPVEAVDPQQHLRVSIGLPLRNQATLTQLLQDLYDRNSPSYRKFLSVAEFTERFCATEADYNAVVNWAKERGFTVVSTPRNRRLVGVEGSVDTINRAFNVTMTQYRHPTEARNFYSPDREPTTVGLSVPLLQISGLNNYTLPHPMLQAAKSQVAPTPQAQSSTGSGPSGTYVPQDMRAAYYGNGALTGTGPYTWDGQSVALVEYGSYNDSDLQLLYSIAGMSPTVPVNITDLDGGNYSCIIDPVYNACDDVEEVIDIAYVIGMAPGLLQVAVYQGNNDFDIYNQIAVDNEPIVSSSWTFDPSSQSIDDSIFQQFAAQGQTFVHASMDNGAYTSSNSDFGDVDVWITEVGGTVLTTTGPLGSWVSETAWGGSGGGYLSGTAIPGWQTVGNVINSSNHGSTTLRNSPDLALAAWNFIGVNHGAAWYGGGTSFAAPIFAGYVALLNQHSQEEGIGRMGWANSLLYAVGTNSGYASGFHDITSGSNGFPAVPGYDLVTGWGSPNGPGLLDQLP